MQDKFWLGNLALMTQKTIEIQHRNLGGKNLKHLKFNRPNGSGVQEGSSLHMGEFSLMN